MLTAKCLYFCIRNEKVEMVRAQNYATIHVVSMFIEMFFLRKLSNEPSHKSRNRTSAFWLRPDFSTLRHLRSMLKNFLFQTWHTMIRWTALSAKWFISHSISLFIAGTWPIIVTQFYYFVLSIKFQKQTQVFELTIFRIKVNSWIVDIQFLKRMKRISTIFAIVAVLPLVH